MNPLLCGQPPRLASSCVYRLKMRIARHAATQAWGACNPYS
jgi:hypothetical protein